MKNGGIGGGSTISGANFENEVDFHTHLTSIKGYSIREIPGKAGSGIYYKSKLVARSFKKRQFYKYLEEFGIIWHDIISRMLIPDHALLVIVRDTLFIIEIKYQNVEGSVDEKLQTCDFKRKQYIKLVSPLNLRVEYVYILNDFFRKDERYKDVLNYIHSVNCHYMFNKLPLAWLGLPDPSK